MQELLLQQEKSIIKEANSKSLREKQMTTALLNINIEDTMGSMNNTKRKNRKKKEEKDDTNNSRSDTAGNIKKAKKTGGQVAINFVEQNGSSAGNIMEPGVSETHVLGVDEQHTNDKEINVANVEDERFDIIDFVWETDSYKKGLFTIKWLNGENAGKMETSNLKNVLYDRPVDALLMMWHKYYLNKSGKEVRAVEEAARGRLNNKLVIKDFVSLEVFGCKMNWLAKSQSYSLFGGARCLRILPGTKRKTVANPTTKGKLKEAPVLIESLIISEPVVMEEEEQELQNDCGQGGNGDAVFDKGLVQGILGDTEQLTCSKNGQNEQVLTADIIVNVEDTVVNSEWAVGSTESISVMKVAHPTTPTRQKIKPTAIIMNTPEHPCGVEHHKFDLIDNKSWVEQRLLRGVCMGTKTPCGKRFVSNITNPHNEYQPSIRNPAYRCAICKQGVCIHCWNDVQEAIASTHQQRQGRNTRSSS